MSKRKKTPTTKNTMTKVKLVKKINELDMKNLLTYGNETGVIGCAYKIVYSENDLTLKEYCAKSIQTMDNMLTTATSFNYRTEEEIDELQYGLNTLVYDYVNKKLSSQFDGMDDKRISEILFTMLSTYVFLKDHVKQYCATKKEERVGLLITYHCEYNAVENSMSTNLKITSIGGLEEWMDRSTEFIAADNATLLKA